MTFTAPTRQGQLLAKDISLLLGALLDKDGKVKDVLMTYMKR